jgi:hypothetical protein
MFRQRTSSIPRHAIKPIVEQLEDRNLLSGAPGQVVNVTLTPQDLANLNAPHGQVETVQIGPGQVETIQFVNPHSTLGQMVENFATSTINSTSNFFTNVTLAVQEGTDAHILAHDPGNLGALTDLFSQTVQLQENAIQLQFGMSVTSALLNEGSASGLIQADEVPALQADLDALSNAASIAQNQANTALQDLNSAISNFISFENGTFVPSNSTSTPTPTPTPTSTPAPTPTPTPTGNPTVTSFDVPSSAPAGSTVMASAHIVGAVPGTQATLSVQGTDGFQTSNSATLDNGSGDVTLSIPGGAKGVTDTVTLTIAGTSINQQSTCVYS